jgi:hypothetical protein
MYLLNSTYVVRLEHLNETPNAADCNALIITCDNTSQFGSSHLEGETENMKSV